MLVHRSALGLLFASQAYTYSPCPLLGQSFEPPSDLADAPTVQDAFANLRAILDNATSTGETDYGVWSPTNNSFSIGVFDATTPGQLFSYQYSSEALQEADQGVKTVTENSIYRIASVSKLITVYLFLVEVGPTYWNRPVTDFVPRLKQAAEECSQKEDAVDCADWRSVTLGSLASHLSGLPRDYSTIAEILSPESAGEDVAVSLGFPPVPESAVPPCGLGTVGCSPEAFLDGYIAEGPNFEPFTTPLYSNGAFAVLAIALENITGRSMSDMLEEDLFGRLNMTDSSLRTSKGLNDSVIPPGAELYFGADLAADNPAGGMFSTQADLARMGQSILSHEILKPAVTKQWLKPTTFTSAATQAVGMPWEIFRVVNTTDHVFDLYSKAGDLPSYSAYFVLSPDYNVGMVILTSGNDTTSTTSQLLNTVTATIFPSLGMTAREQADAKYAGTYASTTEGFNSTLAISTEPGTPGLLISDWISNGTSIDVPLALLAGGAGEVDIRLYPTGLTRKLSSTREQIGYKAVFSPISIQPNGGVFDPSCASWISGAGTYGNVGVDEFLFEVEDGEVVNIEPRAFRAVLEKES